MTITAVIKQTCITLSDVYIKKNLEYFVFRQVADNAALSDSFCGGPESFYIR
jgi:hypothetical protein